MVAHFSDDSSGIQQTNKSNHDIKDPCHTFEITSSDFPPYGFHKQPLFGAPKSFFSSSGSFFWASVSSTCRSKNLKKCREHGKFCEQDLDITPSNPKGWWFFVATREHPLRNDVFEHPKSNVKDLGHPSALKYLLTNVNQTWYFLMNSMNYASVGRRKLSKFTYPLMDLAMPKVIHFYQPCYPYLPKWCLLGP